MNEEHAAVVAHGAAVVRARCDRDQLVSGELVDGIEWVLVRPHNHADLVLL